MSEETKPVVGAIKWTDLTVPDATRVRDFYAAVVGWTHTSFDMGGYEDFCMNTPADGQTVAGICHARGDNAGLPPVWLVYLNVADLAASVAQVAALGGQVLRSPCEMGGGQVAIIRDPAGAVAALFQPGSPA